MLNHIEGCGLARQVGRLGAELHGNKLVVVLIKMQLCGDVWPPLMAIVGHHQ